MDSLLNIKHVENLSAGDVSVCLFICSFVCFRTSQNHPSVCPGAGVLELCQDVVLHDKGLQCGGKGTGDLIEFRKPDCTAVINGETEPSLLFGTREEGPATAGPLFAA